MMNHFYFIASKIMKIAQEQLDGFTYNLQTNQLLSEGKIVAYAATQNSFDYEGLLHCIQHALQEGTQVIGGWFDRTSGLFYFDSCQVFSNLQDAIAFGKEQKQLAIFDLDDLREIRLY